MMKRKILYSSLLLFSELAFANPEGLSQGSASIQHPQPQVMEIHVSQERAILHWDKFSIAQGEMTKFFQNSSKAAVLNRVVGDIPSSILGHLEANGHVYLVNPSGVLIGKDAVINTANFVATTFDIHDAAFLNNEDLYLEGTSKESVVNLGTIRTGMGDITLLAYHVDNQGTLEAPQGVVSLASGTSFLIQPHDHHRVLIRPSTDAFRSEEGTVNNGYIRAVEAELKADGSVYELAIRQDGEIEANQFVEKDGRILLVAEKGVVSVQGTLLAESGKVEIDGERIVLLSSSRIDVSGETRAGDVHVGKTANNIYFQTGAIIDASAKQSGIGGNVYMISKGVLGAFGTIYARAGESAGDGGFVELSSPHFEFHSFVDRRAPSGNDGTLYIDPCDINITNAGVTDGTFPGGIYSPTLATNNINITDLDTALAGGNVIIDTVAGAGGPFGGRLTLVNDFLYTRSANLTLIADETLGINARLENSGSGSIFLQGVTLLVVGNNLAPASVVTTSGAIITGSIRVPPAPVGDINIIGGTVAGASAEVRTDSGLIFLGCNSLLMKGGSAPNCSALITRTASTFDTITVVATGGNIDLLGGSGTGCFAQIGGQSGTLNTRINIVNTTAGLSLLSGSNTGCYTQIGLGNLIPISGTMLGNVLVNVATDAILTAGSGPDCYAQVGHRGGDTATNVNINGNSHLSCDGNLTMNGGIGNRAYALIGHGTDTYGIGDTWTGQVDAVVGGAFSINGGSGNPSNAAIGFLAPSSAAASTGPLTINSSLLSIFCSGAGTSTINSGTGASSQSYIGTFIGSGMGNSASITSFQVNMPSGSLNITASPSAPQAFAGIAMECDVSSSATANLLVNLAGDLTINGGATGLPAQVGNINSSFAGPFTFPTQILARSVTMNANGSGALIFSGGLLFMNIVQSIRGFSSATDTAVIATQQDMRVQAGTNIVFVDNGGFAGFFIRDGITLIRAGQNIALITGARINHIGTNGDLDVIAGISMFIDDNSRIDYAPVGQKANLVVDNLFPSSPGIGPGAFLLNPLGVVSAPSSNLRVFTARQNQNTILGTMNGAAFTAGPLYANVPPEKWGVYYFNPFFYAGQPFTIFYKDSGSFLATPIVVEKAVVITTEVLRDFHPYDEFLGWHLHYNVRFAPAYANKFRQPIEYYLRKKQRGESQPKIDPIELYDDRSRI